MTRTPTGIGTAQVGPMRAIRPSGPTSTTPSYGCAAPPGQTVPRRATPRPSSPGGAAGTRHRSAAARVASRSRPNIPP